MKEVVMKNNMAAFVAFAASSVVCAAEPTVAEIENTIAVSAAETAALQAKLSDRVSLADYASKVKVVSGTNVWTEALQQALNEHEIIVIPAREAKYYIDGTMRIPSNRRIEAKGATITLLPGTDVVMLRNERASDGTLAPTHQNPRDDNIAIVGGRWEDWRRARAGYGKSGRWDMSERKVGNYYGVSTLMLFNCCNHITFKGVTFAYTSAFAYQGGNGSDIHLVDTVFDRCMADGYHLNGNLSRVHVRNARGQVGDDLVALNAYDWLDSSVTFGPQNMILCEDLELIGNGYPAIRILPATYRYKDGTEVDCSISDVVFRRVKGIKCFKMYLQTPNYAIGTEPEWSKIGSGGNLHFEDIEIDFDRPIDMFEAYTGSDPVRGHFGAFEFGANLTSIYFRNLKVKFHADRYPLSHLAVVGPKSVRVKGKNGEPREVFDPYVNCRVGKVVVENLEATGVVPAELVHATVFDDVNGDGRSTGRGEIADTQISTAARSRELFNGKNLDGWYTFLQGRGKNNDPKGVFSVTNGVIHITGEEWGALVTEEEFSDYRLDVEYRFLGTRFSSKLNKALDSGILFHSTGPDGGFSGIWMYSHEYNLITGASGDIWTVGSKKDRADMVVEAEADERIHTDPTMPNWKFAIWKEGGRKIQLTGNNRLCRFDIDPGWTDTPDVKPAVNEYPTGEWNTATLICRGEAVECIFNGKLVNKATRVVPSRGKIQLQSEGCGVEFRRITLTRAEPAK